MIIDNKIIVISTVLATWCNHQSVNLYEILCVLVYSFFLFSYLFSLSFWNRFCVTFMPSFLGFISCFGYILKHCRFFPSELDDCLLECLRIVLFTVNRSSQRASNGIARSWSYWFFTLLNLLEAVLFAGV